MNEIFNSIIPAILSGTVTGVFTIVSMRKDIEWLKQWISGIDSRLTHVERIKVKD